MFERFIHPDQLVDSQGQQEPSLVVQQVNDVYSNIGYSLVQVSYPGCVEHPPFITGFTSTIHNWLLKMVIFVYQVSLPEGKWYILYWYIVLS